MFGSSFKAQLHKVDLADDGLLHKLPFQLVVIITIDLISAWIFNFKVRLEESQL